MPNALEPTTRAGRQAYREQRRMEKAARMSEADQRDSTPSGDGISDAGSQPTKNNEEVKFDMMDNTNELVLERTPTIIASEIKGIQIQAKYMVLYHASEIGRRLVEAKALLGHGAWGDWLENAVSYSQRTAEDLMRIYREYGSGTAALTGTVLNSQAFANLGITQAIALLGLPADEREAFVQDNDLENISVKKLRELLKEREDSLQEKDSSLQAAERARDDANDRARQSDEQLEFAIQEQRKKDDIIDHLTTDKQSSAREISRLQGELNKAKATGASDKKVKDLTDQLDKERQKAKELEKELEMNSKPVVVESVPEEVKQELEALRDSNHKMELRLSQLGNAGALKYKLYFESLRDGFKQLLGALGEIKSADADTYAKHREATMQFLDKMKDSL